MAKYNITHKCGHTATHNIVGTNSNGERDRKVEYLASNVCYECYKAEQTSAAKEQNKDLPELTGSEKQIAWAESIRAKKIQSLKSLLAKVEEMPVNDQTQKATNIINDTINNASSKFWIDNRDCGFGVNWINSKV